MPFTRTPGTRIESLRRVWRMQCRFSGNWRTSANVSLVGRSLQSTALPEFKCPTRQPRSRSPQNPSSRTPCPGCLWRWKRSIGATLQRKKPRLTPWQRTGLIIRSRRRMEKREGRERLGHPLFVPLLRSRCLKSRLGSRRHPLRKLSFLFFSFLKWFDWFLWNFLCIFGRYEYRSWSIFHTTRWLWYLCSNNFFFFWQKLFLFLFLIWHQKIFITPREPVVQYPEFNKSNVLSQVCTVNASNTKCYYLWMLLHF